MFLECNIKYFILFQCQSGCLFCLAAATYHHIEISRLGHVVEVVVVEAEQLRGNLEGYGLAFARFQEHLFKAFQLAYGAGNAAYEVADIELHDFCAVTLAGIGHGDYGSGGAILSHDRGTEGDVAVLESGV